MGETVWELLKTSIFKVGSLINFFEQNECGPIMWRFLWPNRQYNSLQVSTLASPYCNGKSGLIIFRLLSALSAFSNVPPLNHFTQLLALSENLTDEVINIYLIFPNSELLATYLEFSISTLHLPLHVASLMMGLLNASAF